MPVIRGSGGNPSRYGNFVGDVFGLRDVYEKQVENKEQNNKFASWPESAISGYYCGGQSPSLTPAINSNIEKLTFSTENVTTPTSKLSTNNSYARATSSSLYGYICGGFITTYISTINRLDFSTDTVTTPTPKLPAVRGIMGPTSSSFYGYFGAGSATSVVFSNIVRLDFSTETTTLLPQLLSIAKTSVAAVSSSLYGYFGGGDTPPPTLLSTIDRLDFSTETVRTPTPKLSQAKGSVCGDSSNIYGYYFGGFGTLPAPAGSRSTIDRLDFSTETVTTPTPKLPGGKQNAASTSNFAYAYIGGGQLLSAIDRLDFSTENVTTPLNLPRVTSNLTSTSGGQSV